MPRMGDDDCLVSYAGFHDRWDVNETRKAP